MREMPAVKIEEQVRTRPIRLDSAASIEDLRAPWSNRLGALSASQFRICFKWKAKGPTDVEIVDYH
jgi:toxin HigB-1